MTSARLGRLTAYTLLVAGSLVMLVPFIWMLSTAVKPDAEVLVMPPKWIPSEIRWENFVKAWNAAPFGKYFMNSIIVAGLTTITELVICAMAAYAFARMQFAGKNVLFVLFLGSMMVPGEVLLVPNYLTLSQLNWIDSYKALIVPWVVSVFGIFLLRQFFMTIPKELQEAAWIDGCGHFRFLWQIVMPLARPALATVALMKFIGSWNAFLWVLIVTNTPALRTVPVGLNSFSNEVGTVYNLLMAASAFSIAPILVLFFIAQKQFIQAIARTGLKG